MTRTPHDQSTTAGPEELREHVERTRAELGHTIQALAAKTDVKSRAREKAAEVRQQGAGKARELKGRAGGLASQARRMPAQGARSAREHRTVVLAAAGVTVVATATVLWYRRTTRTTSRFC
jgi:hypothetical protein